MSEDTTIVASGDTYGSSVVITELPVSTPVVEQEIQQVVDPQQQIEEENISFERNFSNLLKRVVKKNEDLNELNKLELIPVYQYTGTRDEFYSSFELNDDDEPIDMFFPIILLNESFHEIETRFITNFANSEHETVSNKIYKNSFLIECMFQELKNSYYSKRNTFAEFLRTKMLLQRYNHAPDKTLKRFKSYNILVQHGWGEVEIAGRRNVPLAFINFYTMSLHFFKPNLMHFLKIENAEFKETVLLSIMTRYVTYLKDFSSLNLNNFQALYQNQSALNIYSDMILNVFQRSSKYRSDEKLQDYIARYPNGGVRRIITLISKKVEKSIKEHLGSRDENEYGHHKVNNSRSQYVTLFRDVLKQYDSLIVKEKINAFKVGMQLNTELVKMNWKIVSDTESVPSNVDRSGILYMKDVNIIPKKFVFMKQAYNIVLNENTQSIVDKMTIKQMFFKLTPQGTHVYACPYEHPNISSSGACLGEIKNLSSSVDDLVKLLIEAEKLYDVINYDSSYRKKGLTEFYDLVKDDAIVYDKKILKEEEIKLEKVI